MSSKKRKRIRGTETQCGNSRFFLVTKVLRTCNQFWHLMFMNSFISRKKMNGGNIHEFPHCFERTKKEI